MTYTSGTKVYQITAYFRNPQTGHTTSQEKQFDSREAQLQALAELEQHKALTGVFTAVLSTAETVHF